MSDLNNQDRAAGDLPAFDPAKPFDVAPPKAPEGVGALPAFDPSKPFSPVNAKPPEWREPPPQPQGTVDAPFEPQSKVEYENWQRTAPKGSQVKLPTGETWTQAETPPPPAPGWFGTAIEAGKKGIVSGLTEVAQAPTAFRERAPEDPDTSAVGKLLAEPISQGWSDPKWWIAHIAHGAAASSPSLALGAAGAGAGSLASPAGAVVGGAGGFALGSVLQSIAPAYQKARADGLPHDQAVDRAMIESGIAGAGGAAMALAPMVSLFGREAAGALKRPISEALAQIFGVQPGIGAAQQTATAALEGKTPTLDELGTSYAENAGMGAAMMGGHAAARRVLGHGAAPQAGETPTPQVPAPTPDGAAPQPLLALPPPATLYGPGEPGAGPGVTLGPNGEVVSGRPAFTTGPITPGGEPYTAPAPNTRVISPGQPVAAPPPVVEPSRVDTAPTLANLDQLAATEHAAAQGRPVNPETHLQTALDQLRQQAQTPVAEPAAPMLPPPVSGAPAQPLPQPPVAPPAAEGRPLETPTARPAEPLPFTDSLQMVEPENVRGTAPEAGLVVATRGADGTVYYGRPGEIHFQQAERLAKDGIAYGEVGFANANGEFLNRQQALAELDQNDPVRRREMARSGELDALDYRETDAARGTPEQPFTSHNIRDVEGREPGGTGAERGPAFERPPAPRKEPAPAASQEALATPSVAEAPAPVENIPQVIEGTHTKTGAPIVTVQLPQKVGSDEFKALGKQAREMGGYYSSYRGNGAQPGFIFKTRETADRFADIARGEKPPEVAGETPAPVAETAPEETPTRGTRHPEAVTTDVEAARGQTDENPTAAQAENGNYRHGRVDYHGVPFVIETPSGAWRLGPRDAAGEPSWRAQMPEGVDYGYFSRTEAADGDHVDAYLGPDHDSQRAWVIDQVHPDTKAYDEAKVLIGFSDEGKARTAYEAAFSDGRGDDRIGSITPMSLDQLKDWLKTGDTKSPIGQSPSPIDKATGNDMTLGGIRDWYRNTFMGGQYPNNAALRDKIYELSEELQAARERSVEARLAKIEAENPEISNGVAPQALIDVVSETVNRERDLYRGLREKALKIIRDEGGYSASEATVEPEPSRETIRDDGLTKENHADAGSPVGGDDRGPPGPSRPVKINTAAPTEAALIASLDRADAARNRGTLSGGQKEASENARREMARRFDDAAEAVERERPEVTETDWLRHAEERAARLFPAKPGGKPTPSRRDQRRGFMEAVRLGKQSGEYSGRDYSQGFRDGQKWVEENPRPDNGAVQIVVQTARGRETTLTLPRDPEIIRAVKERYAKLAPEVLYSRGPEGAEDVDNARLRAGLFEMARQQAPGLTLEAFDEAARPGVRGSYRQTETPEGTIERIASIALDHADPRSTLNHEIVHFFRGAGLFKPTEWSLLEREAGRDWRQRFDIDRRYEDQPEPIRQEEAIADAYAAWARGELKGPANGVFGKMRAFFDRVGNWLRGNGFQTVDDIFQRGQSGEIGARPMEEGRPDLGGERESRAPAVPEDPETAAEREALGRIMHTNDRSLWDRARDFIGDIRTDTATRLKQGFLDDLAGLEAALKKEGGTGWQAAKSMPLNMARLTRNLDSVVATVLGVRQGRGEYVGGALQYNPEDGHFSTVEGTKPWAQNFTRVFNAGLQDPWALWAIVNRAKRLKAEGRENNVSDEDIARYENLDQKYIQPDGTNLFRETLDGWRDLNTRMLDMAEATGLINGEQRKLFENDDYVPFFRALDDDAVAGATKAGGKGIANIRAGIKRLTGGEQKVNNIYENMVRNLTSLTDRAMKNAAMREVVNTLSGTDALTPMSKVARENMNTPENRARLEMMGYDPDKMAARDKAAAADLFGMIAKKEPGLVSVMEGGKPQYYQVNDPLLLRSLVSMGPEATRGLIENVLGGAKKVLTNSVTIDPAFMVANLLRDSVHSWVVTGHGFTPGVDTMKGFVSALRNSPSAMALMAGGSGGGHFYAVAPERVRRMMASKDFKDSVLDAPQKIWHALEHVGRASEMANRIAIYEQALKEGVSHTEALARAQDMLNFTMRGDFPAMRFLIETVPFMNARLQGLYRLYRGARDNPSSFLLRGGMFAAAAIALWGANHDDERYKALEDWDRQNYLHFFIGDNHYRLPMPFEVGALFGTVPEMLLNYSENGRTKELRDAFVGMVTNQLNLNPTPQLVKPAIDLYANKDSFTGRPIVNQAEERLKPELQYGPQTSQTMIGLAGSLGVSPDQAEALLKGYGGTLATYLLAASDAALDATDITPPRATRRWDQMPLVSRFVREEPALGSRWLTEFYDLKQDADKLLASVKQYQKLGDAKGAQAIMADQENMRKIGIDKSATAVSAQLGKIRTAMAQINADRLMSPDEKRRRIDTLLAQRNKLAEAVRPMIQSVEQLSARP